MNSLSDEYLPLDDACAEIGMRLGEPISPATLLYVLADFMWLAPAERIPPIGPFVLWDISGTDLHGVLHDDQDCDLDDSRLIPAGLYVFSFGRRDNAVFLNMLAADEAGSWRPTTLNLVRASDLPSADAGETAIWEIWEPDDGLPIRLPRREELRVSPSAVLSQLEWDVARHEFIPYAEAARHLAWMGGGHDVDEHTAWTRAGKWRKVLDDLQGNGQLPLFSLAEKNGVEVFVPSDTVEDSWIAARILDDIFRHSPPELVDDFPRLQGIESNESRSASQSAAPTSSSTDPSTTNAPLSSSRKRRGRPRTKLTDEDVARIPLEALTKSTKDLASQYSVAEKYIQKIIREANKEADIKTGPELIAAWPFSRSDLFKNRTREN